jgi:hypothetical protein
LPETQRLPSIGAGVVAVGRRQGLARLGRHPDRLVELSGPGQRDSEAAEQARASGVTGREQLEGDAEEPSGVGVRPGNLGMADGLPCVPAVMRATISPATSWRTRQKAGVRAKGDDRRRGIGRSVGF